MHQLTSSTLLKNNLFKDTNINSLKLGKQFGKFKSLNIGSTLYKEGDPSDSLYVILNGEINLLKRNSEGKTQSVIFSENDFFGAKELFSNMERCTKTISLTDTYLIELSKDEIEFLVDQYDSVALNIQKGNKDFQFDAEKKEIEERLYGSINEIEINPTEDLIFNSEIVKSAEWEGNVDFKNFKNTVNDYLLYNVKESIENEEKIEYYWNNNENNINENEMSEQTNISATDYMSREQFEMVIKSLQLVNANVKRDDVLANIVDVAVNLTNADRGTLYLVEKETNEIWSKVLVGGELSEIRLHIGEGIAGWVAENGEILNIKDVNNDPRFDGSFDSETGYKTQNMLVYPIKDKTNETVGVLQLLNSLKGDFSNQEEMFLNAISLNIAIALENASLVEKLVDSERSASLGKMGNFLSYELKKPILTCKRYTEHLKKKDLEFDVKRVVNLLDELLDQVTGQLTSATGFTEGTTLLRRQTVSLNDTLFDFANRVHSMVKSYSCKIEHEFSSDVQINVDTKEFYQCYYNIVKNACEALTEGGNIFIATRKADDKIEISFNDKGIGILDSDLKFVFDSLWTKNKKNNSGLGLSISKKIVEDHDGEISITSNEEVGTTVSIRLPIK